MSTSTDRQLFRTTLAQAAEQARAILPESVNGRIESAVRLVLAGDVFFADDGTATVGSASDPAKTYTLAGQACDCQDFAYGKAPEGWCQHKIAANLQKSVERVLARIAAPVDVPLEPWPDNDPGEEPEFMPDPAPAPTIPPLPEAPVSITLKASLDGHEVLVTLRGVDFASVKAQVEEASAWLTAHTPAHTSPREQARAVETPVCKYHGAMKPSTKAPGTWYCASKMGDGSYCKERYPQA